VARIKLAPDGVSSLWRMLVLAAMLCAVIVTGPGCLRTGRAYSGPARPPSAVARVYDSKNISMIAIDDMTSAEYIPWADRELPGIRKGDVVELLPGEHRLVLHYQKQEGNYVLSSGFVTIRHVFEAGKQYTFGMQTAEGPTRTQAKGDDGGGSHLAGTWRPLLIDKSTGAVLPAIVERDFAPSAFAGSAHGATIVGVVKFVMGSGQEVSGAGWPVWIVPRSRGIEKWISDRHTNNTLYPQHQPDILKKQGRHTIAYGTGQYELHDVPPGDYLVLCDMTGDNVAVARVVVGAGERRVIRQDLRWPPRQPAAPAQSSPPPSTQQKPSGSPGQRRPLPEPP
jgi:hypothetical protein